MNIGLFGGTFDPIHTGHLIVAEDVRLKLALDRVLFIPAGQPWLKMEREITPGEHRLEMVKLATDSNPHFEVSGIELERPGPTYSVDTVSALRAELGPGIDLFFIIGFDALSELPVWKESSQLLELCRIVAMRRPGHDKLDWRSLEQVLPAVSSRVDVVDVPQIEISSTGIRERVARGLSLRYLVTETVEHYIQEHQFYTTSGG